MARRVDRYELLEEVGSGGMAVVYRGRDTALDREVAVKLLHPHLAARAESRARFSREARAVARLSHPNIVEIYDFAGEAAVESFLVTEFVRGRTLRAFADEVGIRFPEIGALVARALADALVHAHGAGVIHRDLKPENVLVVERGRPALKLVDFGIARILASDDRMTMTGALVGSPSHMAPEIIEGREADARSDLFSLGTILYWLATGALPFAASNPTATLRRVLEGDCRDPREVQPLVPDGLAAAIARALAVDPAERTPSAAALRDDLDAVLAEAGLEDPEAELVAFLSDPAGYEAAFPGRLAAALTARGEAALAAGSTARALKLFNRVLAVDPANARVTEHLARMARRGRARRALRLAAGVAAAALLAGAGALAWREASRELRARRAAARSAEVARAARAEPAPEEPSTIAPAPTPEAAPGYLAGGASAPQPPPAAAGGGASAAPVAAGGTSSVSILVRPYAQRALLDGVEVASGAQRVTFQLAAGRPHRLRIEHACCEPFVRDFAAGEALPASLELRVPLEPRPARLRVEADDEARVLVDGRLVGTAAESRRAALLVPVPATGPSPYEASAEVRIEAPARAPHVVRMNLRAGAELTVVAPRGAPIQVPAPLAAPVPPAAPVPSGEEPSPAPPAEDPASAPSAEESP